jgi:hypothetical protein
MKKLLLLAFPLLLYGCATEDYALYARAQENIQVAKSNAEIERYRAMSRIAESGDALAKVTAMFALNQNNPGNTQNIPVYAPKNGWDTAREWFSILLPTAVQAYGISASKDVSISASNNSRDVSVSTNNAFVGIAGKIQAPAANISNTLSGSGVLGSGTYSTTTTTDNHTTNPSIVTQIPAGRVCNVDALGNLVCN